MDRNSAEIPAPAAQAESGALDGSAPLPLYHQLFLLLRQQIMDGSHPGGALLPGESELCQRYGVSRITAKRALDELARLGLISRQRGRGSVVTRDLPLPALHSNFDELLDSLLAMGRQTQVALLEFDYIPAPPGVAAELEMESGAPVQFAVRTRSHQGKPFSYLVSYLPEALGRLFEARDLRDSPMLALLEKNGVRIASARQAITSVLAEPKAAAALQLAAGAVLTRLTRVLRDETGQPVQHVTAYYRPDRYQYSMTLMRVSGGGEGEWGVAVPPQG